MAEATGMDPKSVERWVNLGRVPRRRTAIQAAEALREDVHALWPALRQARTARAVSPELVALYDQRADVPASTFVNLFATARQDIDVLVYAAVFLHEAYPRSNPVAAWPCSTTETCKQPQALSFGHTTRRFTTAFTAPTIKCSSIPTSGV
ncbi:hypothetical protein [Nocardia sp. NPDC005825]|uniref:hypothetical protein n=1 Tax=unclassified Nocardia TaxID=2637762 RepID=UPI0033F1EFDC